MAIRTARRDNITELVLTQLADSPQYLDLITWIAEQFDSVDDVLHFISKINVYQANDKWLDLIGLIAGQSRIIDSAITIEYFGFFEDAGSLSFNNGRFFEDGDPLTASSILPDPEYRLAILARIARNYGDVTIGGVTESIQVLTNSDLILISPNYPAKFEVYIGSELSSSVKSIIANTDILPRAAGVGISVITGGDGYNVFGFEEDGFKAFDDAPFIEEIL